MRRLDYAFPGFEKMHFTQLTATMRARQFDRYTRDFLQAHPRGTVVDIGCGLDTRFYRLDNGTAAWFALDLPAVTALRRRLLDENERYRFISASALDFRWPDELGARTGSECLFLAEGVLPYLQPDEVRRLERQHQARFPGAELVFDALPRWQIATGRLHPSLRKTGAHLGWGLDDIRAPERWGSGLRLLSAWYYFEQPELRLRQLRLFRFFPPLGRGFKVLRYRLG